MKPPKIHTLRELLQRPTFFRDATKRDLASEIAEIVIQVRIKNGWTQAVLARKLGTTQSAVARLENYRTLPSLALLDRFAKVCGTHLVIRLESMRDIVPFAVGLLEQKRTGTGMFGPEVEQKSGLQSQIRTGQSTTKGLFRKLNRIHVRAAKSALTPRRKSRRK